MHARERAGQAAVLLALVFCAGCGEGLRVGSELARSFSGDGQTPQPAPAPAQPAQPVPPGQTPGQVQTPQPSPPAAAGPFGPGGSFGGFTPPRPLYPIPAGTFYGNDVVKAMREAGGMFKRRGLWKKEYDEKPVAGEGVVTSVIVGIAAGNHLQLWVDVDDDKTADVVFNYMIGGGPMELVSSLRVSEGDMVWYEGTMKRYSADRLYVLGSVLR